MCVQRGRPRARGGLPRPDAVPRARTSSQGGAVSPGDCGDSAPQAPAPGRAAPLSRSVYRRLENQATPPQTAGGSVQHGSTASSSRQAVRRGKTTCDAAGRHQASAERAERERALRLDTDASRNANTKYFGWDILAFRQTVQFTLPSSTSTRRLLDSSTDWAKEWAIPKDRKNTWRAREGPGCYRDDRLAQHKNERALL
uniref:Uncharacterized protein n=1 Tax=Rangifer tarandus platyrhynchus TaxID=3082113 RepID=A0ACB0F8S8_RANTA|nr:unnamed protein product [Rangifer tarandus platyrhynchus]